MSNRVVYVLMSLHYAATTAGSFENMLIHGGQASEMRERENRVDAKQVVFIGLVTVGYQDSRVLHIFVNFFK